MMKTLCVAVVVLSLTSVCQPAPLACDQLLKPVDKSPDLSGRWYIIAMSSDICLGPALFNALFWPSFAVDITPKDTPNVYNASFKFRMYGYCGEEREPFLFKNNALFNIDDNSAPTGDPNVLLQTGCPDCLVVKMKDSVNIFLLLSRRQNVTAAELKEFETRADCLGWYKPQILNTDHDYENCNTTDDPAVLSGMIHQRLKNTFAAPLNCIKEKFLYYSNVAYMWAQQKWNNFWYDLCDAQPEYFFFEHNAMFDVDSNNALTSFPDVLLQTGCPDCIALKGNDTIDRFLLLSRRKTVTAAELKEFEMQAACLGWSKPQVLNTDHDYKNCKTIDDDTDIDISALWSKMYERLKTTYREPLKCIANIISDYLHAFFEFTQEM